jgi:hypothetical protein
MASDPQSLTEFLNVDLDLRGDGLEELLRYLGSSVLVMHQTAHELALELSNRVDDIQSAEKPYSALFTISSSRVSQLASLQAEIVVTVYAPIE